MKDILLKKNGSLNEEGINEYISTYGINTPYNNPSSIYNEQTPLHVAISSNEIQSDIKLKLVSYLISKGASVKDGLGAALSQQNFELADLLLKEGANIKEPYRYKRVIDLALDLKNEQILLWLLKNAKSLFIELDTDRFEKYYQNVAACSTS